MVGWRVWLLRDCSLEPQRENRRASWWRERQHAKGNNVIHRWIDIRCCLFQPFGAVEVCSELASWPAGWNHGAEPSKTKNLCDIINQFNGVATLLTVYIKHSLVRDHGLGWNEHWRELRHHGSNNNHAVCVKRPALLQQISTRLTGEKRGTRFSLFKSDFLLTLLLANIVTWLPPITTLTRGVLSLQHKYVILGQKQLWMVFFLSSQHHTIAKKHQRLIVNNK